MQRALFLPTRRYARLCLHCFDAVGWAAGRVSGLLKIERWGVGMVRPVCLEQGADLHMPS